MASWFVRSTACSAVTALLVANCEVLHANHRRAAYGPPPGHCHALAPQFAQPLPRYAAAPQVVALPQPAAIPPFLVPILTTVGQDLAGLAAQRLLEIIHDRFGGDMSKPPRPNPVDFEVIANPELTALEARLDALEKKLGPVSPPTEVKKAAIDLPQGKPSEFPRFLFPQ